MKIAITGASGFIGKNLCKHLQNKGYQTIAVIRSTEKAELLKKYGCETRNGDVTDYHSLKEAFKSASVVIHLAALFNNPENSWNDYKDVNVDGVKNVLKVASEEGIERVIHCSTVGVAINGFPPYDENTPYSPPAWDKYETTKCTGEKLVLDYYRKYQMPVVVIRPAQVYGPEDTSKLKFYKMVKKGVIVNPSDTLKHLIYIEDLCRAFELAIKSKEAVGEPIIIGGEKAILLKDLISIAAKELGVNVPRFIIPATFVTCIAAVTEKLCNMLNVKPIIFRRSMDFFTKSVEFDVGKAKKLLGFECETEVETGVRKTVEWYKKKGLI